MLMRRSAPIGPSPTLPSIMRRGQPLARDGQKDGAEDNGDDAHGESEAMRKFSLAV